MRIVHLCRVGWPSVGGMERMVDGLSRFQARAGHHVTVVTCRRLGDRRVDHSMRQGVRYHRVRAVGRGGYTIPWGLDRLMDGADLVHVHGLDGFADVAVRISRAPVGISTHGGPLHTGRRRWLKSMALRTWIRSTARRAGAVWYTSRADRRALSMMQRPGPVVPNGLDLQPWLSLPRAPEPGVWVVPGRVTPHKRIEAVIAVAGRTEPRPTVVVMGVSDNAEYVGLLRSEAQRQGVPLRWVSGASDGTFRQWICRAREVFFPSRYEGFGLGVVEAMAGGATVWVSDIPAHRERVRHGVDGWVVNFDDVEAVAHAVADPHRRSVDDAARASASVSDWSEVGPMWEGAYDDLLKGGRP